MAVLPLSAQSRHASWFLFMLIYLALLTSFTLLSPPGFTSFDIVLVVISVFYILAISLSPPLIVLVLSCIRITCFRSFGHRSIQIIGTALKLYPFILLLLVLELWLSLPLNGSLLARRLLLRIVVPSALWGSFVVVLIAIYAVAAIGLAKQYDLSSSLRVTDSIIEMPYTSLSHFADPQSTIQRLWYLSVRAVLWFMGVLILCLALRETLDFDYTKEVQDWNTRWRPANTKWSRLYCVPGHSIIKFVQLITRYLRYAKLRHAEWRSRYAALDEDSQETEEGDIMDD